MYEHTDLTDLVSFAVDFTELNMFLLIRGLLLYIFLEGQVHLSVFDAT
jgi:hypothetical protein